VRQATARVTMAEVAAAAGVSVPTVSKVLNGRGDVAPATRSRVEALLAELGYARTTAPAHPVGVVDLVVKELGAWGVEIIRGAEEAALSLGRRLAVSVPGPGGSSEQRWLTSLASSPTDGVVLALTELTAEHRRVLGALRVPVVIVDPVGQPDPDMSSVGAANWTGGLTATEHLLALGHRRIATITGRPSVLCSAARLDGYRAALVRAGVEPDPELVAVGDFHYESAVEAASALLEKPDPPTAIFAASDEQAMGVYAAARRHGLRIPDDLSVVGFDDLPLAQWVPPPLTTLHQPLAEMAALATRMALRDGPGVSRRAELATDLVVRESTAPPRR